MTSIPRVALFALLAPLVGVTLICALVVVQPEGALADLPGTVVAFQRAIGLFLLVGMPIAILLEVVVGLPVARVLQRHQRFGPVSVLTTAGLIGAVGFAVPMSLMPYGDNLTAILESSAIGAAGGVAGGVVFWAGVWRGASGADPGVGS